MRIHFDNDARPKRIVKSLKKRLEVRGYQIQRAQSTAARMFGYCSWADLLQNLGKQKPTPFDAFVDPEVVAARRTRYISILVDFGVSRADAEEVVDEIGPTSAGRFSSDG